MKEDLISLFIFLGVWFFMLVVAQLATTPLFHLFGMPYNTIQDCMKAIISDNTNTDKIFFLTSSILQSIVGTLGAIFVFIQIFIKKPILTYLDLDQKLSFKKLITFSFFLILFYPTISVIYSLNMSFVQSDQHLLQIENQLIGSNSVLILGLNTLLFGILAGLGEECMYRGIIQKKLIKTTSPFSAILLTSFLFTVMHFQWEGVFPRFLISCFFGFIYYLSKNLWYTISLHILFNLTQVYFVYITNVSGVEFDSSLINHSFVNQIVLLAVSWLGIYIFYNYNRELFKINHESKTTS